MEGAKDNLQCGKMENDARMASKHLSWLDFLER